ncbi:maltose alpha-D-glucosyltransferase/alpha-amylase [Desulfobaculum xiamenense]|uniref:maltose alpha-D-glucosyltransferase n=1 Tax=Desulfobaculum xiamenense TaxID=995050 RepID=A0A846QGV2_9BACT|nr:maltose alpha-D-glucosyltransferase [Desulfobaculum xiamenense]NJB68036.1 maltose alpha-D-glucosyltransferase/alpha-amylase [Desulfobaculum xiamenense]
MARRRQASGNGANPLWYKDAVIYEVHVRAFHDSDGDGVGDFRGLTEKLDYLQDLGVTAIWLLPFFPSPLKDDGYDTADYRDVHPAYGTMRDFRTFLREAHARGLKVITELVLNHTSDAHPWFQQARRAKPGTAARDFYVWSDTHRRYEEARIIFQDFENSNWTWDDVAGAYYWHRFYSHQPDLNFDNPAVRKTMTRVVDYWFKLGVDGLRLDAVPYLYEREGTNCENLPETYDFLRELRTHIDAKFEDRMLLAEANQWPEDSAAYFGNGDMCHMAFHFPIMPRLFMALHMEDRFPLIDILEQTPEIPATSQWALFLRNHDELTLEMVTDEERDMMYRVYARDPQMRVNLGIRRRFAPLMGNNRRMIELMNALLLSLPGTPVLYYGDEIGMGDNIYLGDRNGVRTPMQWSPDRNAGFSRANPQQLYLPVVIDPEYHFETVNVEAQENNPHSLLWWMRRIIALRRRHRAFGRGEMTFFTPENRKLLCFVRSHGDECILVVANLSRHVQHAEIDLSAHMGMVPVEMFGRAEFPPIGPRPYPLTIGGHSFYWFLLEPQHAQEAAAGRTPDTQPIECAESWEEIFEAPASGLLCRRLPEVIAAAPWYCAGPRRAIASAGIRERLAVSDTEPPAHIVLVDVEYAGGGEDCISLPMAWATGERAARIAQTNPHAVIARVRLRNSGEEGIVFDALVSRTFCIALLGNVPRHTGAPERAGRISVSRTRALRGMVRDAELTLHAPSARVDQNNSVVVFGDSVVLKFFRRLDPGVSPELEVGRFLNERGYPHSPQLRGAIEYRRDRLESPMTIATLTDYVPNQGTAWQYVMEMLRGVFEHAQARREAAPSTPTAHMLELGAAQAPPEATEMFGASIGRFGVLGRRTGEMHLALASGAGQPGAEAFEPEPFTRLYQRSLYQGLRSNVGRVWPLLRKKLDTLPGHTQDDAQWGMASRQTILDILRKVTDHRFGGRRIRCHGDFHLGHALLTGQDFTIIDFEGDPDRTWGERRLLRSPLRDVATLLRSMDYAGFAAVSAHAEQGFVRPGGGEALLCWARCWSHWAGVAFVEGYMDAVAGVDIVPATTDETRILLDAFLIDRAVTELAEELDNRPAWAGVPLAAIRAIVEATMRENS